MNEPNASNYGNEHDDSPMHESMQASLRRNGYSGESYRKPSGDSYRVIRRSVERRNGRKMRGK